MHPLMLTLAFLMLIATLVTAEVSQFIERSAREKGWQYYASANKEKNEEIAASLFHEIRALIPESQAENEEFKPSSPTVKKTYVRKSVPLNFNLACPPNNARLNLHALLYGNEENELFEVGAELLRRLYGSSSYFRAQGRLEYRLLESLRGKQEEMKEFSTIDELATLVFSDASFQKIFFVLLRGGLDEEGKRLPSLLHYMTFDKNPHGEQKKINLMFASAELIGATFRDERITKELLEARENLWRMILDQEEHRLERTKESCKSRTEIKKELQQLFEGIVSKYGRDYEKEKKLFDFGLGKQGSVLFLLDETTGNIVREKLPIVKNRPLSKFALLGKMNSFLANLRQNFESI